MFDTQIIKNRFIGLMKIIFFVLFLRGTCDLFWNPLLDLASFIDNGIYMLSTFILGIYLRTIVTYFLAKKLGIVRALDKIPFVFSLILVLIIDFFVSICVDWYDSYFHEWIVYNSISYTTHIFFLSYGFFYPFLTYKAVKFLIRKFPKLSWLGKFYPKFLNSISTLKACLIAVVPIFIDIIAFHNELFGSWEYCYFVCLEIFFVILLIIIMTELVKLYRNKYTKNI